MKGLLDKDNKIVKDVLNVRDMENINDILKIGGDRYYNLYRKKVFFRL